MSLLSALVVKWQFGCGRSFDRSSQFRFLSLGILDFLMSCFGVFQLLRLLVIYLFGQTYNRACWVKSPCLLWSILVTFEVLRRMSDVCMKSMHSEVAKLNFRNDPGKSCFCVSFQVFRAKLRGDPWAFIRKSMAI